MCIYSPTIPSLRSMLQVNDAESEANYASTSSSVTHPYFRLNDQCETGYEFCLQLKPVDCDFYQQTDQDSAMCIPSQLYQAIDMCNERSPSTPKYKMCDGAFEWCDGGAPIISVLRKIDWLMIGCAQGVIGRECDLRHRCFQQCLKERQFGECNFFAINTYKFTSSHLRKGIDNCRTFSTVDGTGYSSSSCGPWKVYQMNCVNGACDDVKGIASTAAAPLTAASTVKPEYSTTVSALYVLRHTILCTCIKSMFSCNLLCY